MIQLVFLSLLASPLAHASIMGGDGWKNSLNPTGTVEEDTIKPCFYWVNDAEEEDCEDIKAEFEITQEQLTSWVSFVFSLSSFYILFSRVLDAD